MNLNKLTIDECIKGLKKREFTSREITQDCLDQISKYDSQIHAFITVCGERAIKESEKADEIIKREGEQAFIRKPLLGIPYACKDNYSTRGIETTAGSEVLKGYIPPYESTVTQRIMNAGGILLGKTNMDAFAHGSSTETSDFFKTKNAWNYDRVPGGSSGGSAAAVSADMCIFSIGSETAGSIRLPASWCGVTGLKPTYGRVSRYGLIAMASSTDSPGPLAKNAEDCSYILNIIAGKDSCDATTSTVSVENYISFNEKNDNSKPLKGIRIGKPLSYFNIDMEEGYKEKVNESLKVFSDLGAEIIDIDLLDPKYSIAVYTIIQRSEVSSNLGRYDGIRYGQGRDKFGFEAKKRAMLGTYTLSAGYYDAYYAKAQKVRTLIINNFKECFNKVDLIIGPSTPCTAMKFGESDKSSMFGELMDVLAEPSSIAGLCGISIPCGFLNNLPVGVQLIGRMFEEKQLLYSAGEYQRVVNYHKERPKLK